MSSSPSPCIVIVGAGLAGTELACALREYGHEGRIVVLGREPWMPYDRPPLSKGYLKGTHRREQLWLRSEAVYAEQNIEVVPGSIVSTIDRPGRRVGLVGGEWMPYDQLVLATGGEARTLPIAGATLEGVMSLKTMDDADALIARLAQRPRVAVVGGGYVGMEFAATARLAGCDVTLIEDKANVLSRSVSSVIASYLQQEYERMGVKILTQARVAGLEGHHMVQSVALADGRHLEADLVLVSVGNQASDALARESGLTLVDGGGILVNQNGRTSDPNIFAAGDCAARLYDGFAHPLRLESVQSTVAQAKRVAAQIMAQSEAEDEVPWFWSDQFDIKLQMAGLPLPGDEEIVRGDPQSGRFSIVYQNASRMTAIHCVNAAGDFSAGKKMIGQRRCFAREQLCDPQVPLRDMARSTRTVVA